MFGYKTKRALRSKIVELELEVGRLQNELISEIYRGNRYKKKVIELNTEVDALRKDYE